MNLRFKLIFTNFIFLFLLNNSFAQIINPLDGVAAFKDNEVNCSKFSKKISQSCDKCFDDGNLYLGQSVIDFKARRVNTTWDTEIIFSDNWGSFSYESLQDGSGFQDSGSLTEFTPNLTWNSYKSRLYTTIGPQSTVDILKFKNGKGIVFSKASNKMNPMEPVLRMDVVVNSQMFSNKKLNESIKYNRSCFFYSPRWCGDGIQEAQEQCDMGSNNGQMGSLCSATCNTVK